MRSLLFGASQALQKHIQCLGQFEAATYGFLPKQAIEYSRVWVSKCPLERELGFKIFEQSSSLDSNTIIMSTLGSLAVWDTALVET